MKVYLGRSGFTLIELLIVIVIIGGLAIGAAAPYAAYSEKARVRITLSKAEQTLSKAKILASTGFSPDGVNVDMGVLIAQNSDRIEIYRADHTKNALPKNTGDWTLYSTILFESGIQVFSIEPKNPGSPKVDTVAFVYRAPRGKKEVFFPATSDHPIDISGGGEIIFASGKTKHLAPWTDRITKLSITP